MEGNIDEVDNAVEEEIDLESIPGQVGTAIVKSLDGSLARPCTGQLTEKDVSIIYLILLEIGALLRKNTSGVEEPPSYMEVAQGKRKCEGLRRITVSFPSTRYAATVAKDGCIYIIKMKVASS